MKVYLYGKEQLILAALLQFGFYKIDSIPLFKDDPGLCSDIVTVDDMVVSTGRYPSCHIYDGDKCFRIGYDPEEMKKLEDDLIGKTVEVKYLTDVPWLQSEPHIVEIKYNYKVYLDINDSMEYNAEYWNSNKRILIFVFVILSIILLLICDRRAGRYVRYDTPLLRLLLVFPLLFKRGEKRKEYKEKLEVSSCDNYEVEDMLQKIERARKEHKKDEAYQKKVKRRKKRKRKMKKKRK